MDVKHTVIEPLLYHSICLKAENALSDVEEVRTRNSWVKSYQLVNFWQHASVWITFHCIADSSNTGNFIDLW